MKVTFTYSNGKEYSCEIADSICRRAAKKFGYKQPEGLTDTSEAYLVGQFISNIKQAAGNNIIDEAVEAAKENAKAEIAAIEAVVVTEVADTKVK